MEDTIKMSIHLPAERHRLLKVYAAQRGETMQGIVSDFLVKKIGSIDGGEVEEVRESQPKKKRFLREVEAILDSEDRVAIDHLRNAVETALELVKRRQEWSREGAEASAGSSRELKT